MAFICCMNCFCFFGFLFVSPANALQMEQATQATQATNKEIQPKSYQCWNGDTKLPWYKCHNVFNNNTMSSTTTTRMQAQRRHKIWGCIPLLLPRLPMLPSQCYSTKQPGNLSNLGGNKEIQTDTHNVTVRQDLLTLRHSFCSDICRNDCFITITRSLSFHK